MSYKPIIPEVEEKLLQWWKGLEDNRGDRAMLRRATFTDDILLTSGFFNFLHSVIGVQNIDLENNNTVTSYAIVAAIVARVKENIEDKKFSFAKSLASSKENTDSPPVMSQLRFQKLQKSDDPEQFFIRMRRAVDLLKGQVNIVSLTNDILHWTNEFYYGKDDLPKNSLAFKWATDYYNTVKK